MSTKRKYAISCEGRPDDTLTGGYYVCAMTAARNYATLYLAGYVVVSCHYVRVQDTDKHGLHTLWRAEAYNHDAGLGVVIWVREL